MRESECIIAISSRVSAKGLSVSAVKMGNEGKKFCGNEEILGF
jgi:hypothetical protein